MSIELDAVDVHNAPGEKKYQWCVRGRMGKSLHQNDKSASDSSPEGKTE
jgi:hypothetical protein